METCFARVKTRNNAEHIPVSDNRVVEFNRLASVVTYNWHLEISNNEFATDEQIIKAIQSINGAEGERQVISRIWHGWTTPQNAGKYEVLLKEEIFVGIQERHIRGFRGIQLLRRAINHEVEFITIMTFESLNAVREFAGEDYEAAVVPEKARKLLSRFDQNSQHYEIIIA